MEWRPLYVSSSERPWEERALRRDLKVSFLLS
jgi:hypothetical protein